MLEGPPASKAIQQEWDRLRARKSWGENHPREWSDVAREARETGDEVHFGVIVGFVAEKNTDRPPGDPGRKLKGRVVVQGGNVKSQSWEAPALRTWVARHLLWMREGQRAHSGYVRITRSNSPTQSRHTYRLRRGEHQLGSCCLATSSLQHGTT